MSSLPPSRRKFPHKAASLWYPCPICLRPFEKLADFFEHATKRHGDEGNKYVRHLKPEGCSPTAPSGLDEGEAKGSKGEPPKPTSSGAEAQQKPPRVKCSICGETFATKANLKRHRNIHEKKLHFKCKFCLAAFPRKDNLTRHVKLIHSRANAQGENQGSKVK